MIHHNFRIATFFLIILALMFTSGCSKESPSNSNTGQLNVKITDAPFPVDMVDYANVTINKVEIRAMAPDSGKAYITLTDEDFSETFDLLLLQNGVTGDLVEIDLPVGSYDLVRLHVDSAEIKVKDGDVYHLKVPSGAQTGIKVFIEPPIEVVGGLSAELLLDFDLSNSFVVKGNPNTPAGINGFNFKPVVRAINSSSSGRVSGIVTDTTNAPIENATVYSEIAPSDTLFTLTDATGFYALVGLAPGTYKIIAQEASHDTVSVENVEVTTGNNTKQDFVLTPQ